MRRLLVVLLLVAGVAGCTSDDPPTVKSDDSSTSSSTSSASSSSTSTSAGAGCAADTSDKSEPTRQPRAEMTALRTGSDAGFDRVVFEFTGTSPGYRIGYAATPLTEDGSGKAVALKGKYAIEIHMDNASSYHLAGDSSAPTYTGPSRVAVSGSEVVEVVRTGDFEGVLSWGIGVKDKAGFRVSRLDGPPRLLIEVCGSAGST